MFSLLELLPESFLLNILDVDTSFNPEEVAPCQHLLGTGRARLIGFELIAKAAARVADLGGLAALRGGLRSRLLASPRLDTAGFARDFSEALWAMWDQRRVA